MKAALPTSPGVATSEAMPRSGQSASSGSSFGAELQSACSSGAKPEGPSKVTASDPHGADVARTSNPRTNDPKGAKRARPESSQDGTPLPGLLLCIPAQQNAADVQPLPPDSAGDDATVDLKQTPVVSEEGGGGTGGTNLLLQPGTIAEKTTAILPDLAAAQPDTSSNLNNESGFAMVDAAPEPQTGGPGDPASVVARKSLSVQVSAKGTRLSMDDARGGSSSTFSSEGALSSAKKDEAASEPASLAQPGASATLTTLTDEGDGLAQLGSSPGAVAAAPLTSTVTHMQSQTMQDAGPSLNRKDTSHTKEIANPVFSSGADAEPASALRVQPWVARVSDSAADDGAVPDEGSDAWPEKAGAQKAALLATHDSASVGAIFTAANPPGTENATSTQLRTPQTSSSPGLVRDFDTTQPSPLSSLQSAQLLRRVEQAEIRIGVNTENFGPVRLQTSLDADRVAALVDTAHPALRAALVSEAGTLEKAMAQHRLQLQALDVSGGQAQASSGGFADHRHEPPPRASAGAAWPLRSQQPGAQPSVPTATNSGKTYRLDIQA